MTDLTDKWKKGELPEGWYYIKDENGQIIIAEYSAYCIDKETNETECDWSCSSEPEQVLAQVPSYDEWKAKLEENAQLKELLKECKMPLEVYNEMFGNKEELLTKIDEALK